ncbi:MAG: radical SAM family heme chaperone HemW [Nitrospiraceae bacterium]
MPIEAGRRQHSTLPDILRSLGLYVHIPFCRTRCAFCSFYLQVWRPDRVEGFLAALQKEFSLYARRPELSGRPLSSIYLGGGTPTVLSADQLCDLLTTIRQVFTCRPDAEITVEAHPDTVSDEMLTRLREAGASRVSLGAESLNDAELIRIGRPSPAANVVRAVEWVRTAGFDHLNLDLMYGLPGQSMGSWEESLAGVIALRPDHVSCYALTIEPETALAQAIEAGSVQQPDPEMQTAMEQEAERVLERAGYDHYEISNYAKPGHLCRHNLLYWQAGDYLGLGPSAQSYVDGWRFGNIADLAQYEARLTDGLLPLDHREFLTPGQRNREALVFGLRQLAGSDDRWLDSLCADPQWHRRLTTLLDEQLLERKGGRIRLTAAGRQVADSVALQLI